MGLKDKKIDKTPVEDDIEEDENDSLDDEEEVRMNLYRLTSKSKLSKK